MGIVLEASNLHKCYGKREVLRGVDLTVEQGEVLALLGSSGSGKTTLLRCLNFLERADIGQLTIADQTVDMKRAKKSEILAMRRKTAMVFQHYELFQNKTALQNITEGLIVARKVPKEEAIAQATQALIQVGLEDRADSYPHQLSGGQQQRIGIARALALNPEVLLFDEPTSALDPEMVGDVLLLIKEVANSGRTLILVTHEMEFAYQLARRVMFLDGGEFVEAGTPNELFGNPKQERTKQFLSRFKASKNPEYFI